MKHTNKQSSQKSRALALFVLAPILCFAFLVLGIFARRVMAPPAVAVAACGYALPFLVLLISELTAARSLRRYAAMSVADMQTFLRSNKEQGELQQKLADLRRLRKLSDLWAVLLGVLALADSFLSGLTFNTGISTPLWFLSSLMLAAAFGRIRFAAPAEDVSEEEGAIDRSELPQLYGHAEKAAQTLRCTDAIRITLTPDFNAGIARVGKAISIALGSQMLAAMSEEELYAVLLHEISHVTDDPAQVERRYNAWLENERDSRPLAFLTTRFFNYPDTQFAVRYALYELASSVQIESDADAAMIEYGSREAAASALLKLKYYELFEWESEAYFAHSTLDETLSWMARDEANAFLAALPERKADWDRLTRSEILANNASHPTTWMRLQAFGVSEPVMLAPGHSEAYAAEVAHAQELMIRQLQSINDEAAYSARIDKLRETVSSWESEGKPLVVEEYTDVVSALRDLGRLDEALELCENAIRAFDADTPVSFPYYFRGCARLHRWDESGLEDVYRALRQSSDGSLIEEGLEQIGAFCCLTGNQTELERYREEGVKLMQKEKDVYSELGILRKSDELRAEKLPEELHSSLYRYIRSFAGDDIEAIYLVRKVISEDFFTSVMIVRFAESADADTRAEIMHKIFNVLDNNTNWQFSLFEYEDVQHVRPEQIPGSLFLEKAREKE